MLTHQSNNNYFNENNIVAIKDYNEMKNAVRVAVLLKHHTYGNNRQIAMQEI